MSTGSIAPSWKYLRPHRRGEPLSIEGENVWDHDWVPTGAIATVADPQHGTPRRFEVWRIARAGRPDIVFAAGEFSNGIWGFFLPADG